MITSKTTYPIFALMSASFVLLLVGVLGASPQAPSGRSGAVPGPPLNWSPNSVSAIVTRGGRTEIQVSLNIIESVGSVALQIAPEVDPYVDVIPATIGNARAGDAIPIRIIIQASATGPLGSFDGTIQVREQVTGQRQGRVFARPLPVHLLIREEQGVPGPDSDGNGVWDYIDQYINTVFPGTQNASTRSAARQYARAIEGGLLNADNKARAIQFAAASDRATECMYYLRPQDAAAAIADLEAAILNTQLRSKTFVMWSEQSAGQVFPSVPFSQRATSCVVD
jgi:hypothetical protein